MLLSFPLLPVVTQKSHTDCMTPQILQVSSYLTHQGPILQPQVVYEIEFICSDCRAHLVTLWYNVGQRHCFQHHITSSFLSHENISGNHGLVIKESYCMVFPGCYSSYSKSGSTNKT